MMSSWWWIWMAFMFMVIVPPLGYGWGYRGWGPPYPRYIQQRRGQQAVASGGDAPFDHQSWGWGGDVVWGALLIGLVLAGVAFWWH